MAAIPAVAPPMPRSPRKILVIAVPVLGDVLLSTPLISGLRKRWPEADIDVLTRVGGRGVIEGNPDVTAVIELPAKPSAGMLLGFFSRRLRRYDRVFSIGANDRAVTYSLLLGRHRSALVDEAHRNRRLKERLCQRTTPVEATRLHTIVRNLKLLPDDDSNARAVDVTLPDDPGADRQIEGLLGENWQSLPYAVVHPNSAVALKRWHRSGWLEVIRHLRANGLRVLVSGGPDEEDRRYVEDELRLSESGAELLVGRLSLAGIARLLSGCQVYVGVDTLVSHMAAAAGAPTVALFGPVSPLTWGPWPKGVAAVGSPWRKHGSQRCGNVYIVQGMACDAPCGRSSCEQPRNATSLCLDELAPNAVVTAIDRMLEATTPDVPARNAARRIAAG